MAEDSSVAAADSTVCRRSWLDSIYGPIRRMRKSKIQVVIFAFRRKHVIRGDLCWYPCSETQFIEELKNRGINEIVWETLLCEEFRAKDYDERDGWQYWVCQPENVVYGPVGRGTRDVSMESYVALYDKVYMRFTRKENMMWKIEVFFEGRLVRVVDDFVDDLNLDELEDEMFAENAASFEIIM